MSARPGPSGGYRVSDIPTGILNPLLSPFPQKIFPNFLF